MKDRRLSPASPQFLLLLSYYRIRQLTIVPAYASLVKHGTSKSSSLRQIHKDHTAYCSGEVYPRTFKLIRVHVNNFSSFFLGGEQEKMATKFTRLLTVHSVFQ